MATLDDKILGEKLHNYCSSSEESDGDNSDSEKCASNEGPPCELPEPNKWEGTSTNTGPKGVIKDWQRFKQLETEKRSDSESERLALMNKLSMTVQTALDVEREKAAKEDADIAELLDDDFLLEYQRKRMEEMLKKTEHNEKFGELLYLTNGQEYLDAIDKEHKAVKVIIHIYEQNVEACRYMNEALTTLSKVYINVKFCSIIGSRAGMSRDFKIKGVPALLIYKGGQIVGNFVRLSDDLGNEFDAEDVQTYLVEHGMLEDKSCQPLIIRNEEGDSSD